MPDPSVAVRDEEECVRDFLDKGNVEEEVACDLVLREEADVNDSFVDIMSGLTALGSVELEGWTFPDALARANSSTGKLAESVVDKSHLTTFSLLSSFPLAFNLWEYIAGHSFFSIS